MPNAAQTAILERFIGKDGFFFRTIRDNEVFNLGTKLLYLERAMSVNAETLLQYLDKLYNPHGSQEEVKQNLKIITALKGVNDLWFNNTIRFCGGRTKHALDYFFEATGDVNLDELKEIIQTNIKQRIFELSQQQDTATITLEKAAREAAETTMVKQTDWHNQLDWSDDRQPLMQPGKTSFYGLLTGVQSLLLSPELKGIAREYSYDLFTIIKLFNITFEELRYIPAAKFKIIFPNPRAALRLVQDAGVSFNDLVSYDDAMLQKLIDNSFSIVALARIGLPFKDLLSVEPWRFARLLRSADEFCKLVKELSITPQDMLKFDETQFNCLLNSHAKFIDIVKKINVRLEDLVTIKLDTLLSFLRRSDRFIEVIVTTQIKFTTLVELVQLDAGIFQAIADNRKTFDDIAERYSVTQETFSNLSAKQLKTIISDPESEESKRILQPFRRRLGCVLS